MEKGSSSTNDTETVGCPYAKNEPWPKLILYKNSFKIDHNLNVKLYNL